MSNQYITEKKHIAKKNIKRVLDDAYFGLVWSFFRLGSKHADAQTLIQQLGIQQQDVTSLNKGEIVFFNVAETHEKELAAGAAIYLPATPSKLSGLSRIRFGIHRYRYHGTGYYSSKGNAGCF